MIRSGSSQQNCGYQSSQSYLDYSQVAPQFTNQNHFSFESKK